MQSGQEEILTQLYYAQKFKVLCAVSNILTLVSPMDQGVLALTVLHVEQVTVGEMEQSAGLLPLFICSGSAIA